METRGMIRWLGLQVTQPGNVSHNELENCHLQWNFPLNMGDFRVDLRVFVNLPEGNICNMQSSAIFCKLEGRFQHCQFQAFLRLQIMIWNSMKLDGGPCHICMYNMCLYIYIYIYICTQSCMYTMELHHGIYDYFRLYVTFLSLNSQSRLGF